jgi:hypothetical protein
MMIVLPLNEGGSIVVNLLLEIALALSVNRGQQLSIDL